MKKIMMAIAAILLPVQAFGVYPIIWRNRLPGKINKT